ncbi:MAG TPA: adenosine deaminase [Gemmatimonadaceae bacterium]|nr:adenosine deaminase [Gemmatimonadaceae bacterium]
MLTSEQLRRIPKAELHCHLDGSVRPATLLELGHEYKVKMPETSADALRDYMLVSDARSLEDYLKRFEVTVSVMQTAEAIERIAYELGEDAAKDGVRYIEVRNAPILNSRGKLDMGEALEAQLRGLERAQQDHGIIARSIVCSLRQLPPETSLELAQLAVAYKSRGVVAFDLAGGEAGYPASAHGDAFAYARKHNLAVTIHAGEGDGARSVRDAVHKCGADRLGHATRLIEDPELTQYVNDRRIGLEICLTSNVQTHAAKSYETHPLRSYFEKGMNATLNTDNRLMSGTTLTDEYMYAAKHLDFTFDELCTLALNGFESAFLPWEQRVALLKEVSTEMAGLSAEAA